MGLDSSMEGKRLDLSAPLISVRRHFSGPLPRLPSSSTSFANAAAAANSRARDTAGGQGSRKSSSLPFYTSDLRSGPVLNDGAVPFVWEQSPGLPKDGGGGAPDEAFGGPLLAPKPPPGRTPRRLPDEKEEGPIRADAAAVPPISFASASAANSASTTSTGTSLNGSFSMSSGRSRNGLKSNLEPLVAKPPIMEEQLSSSDERDGEEEEDAFSDVLDTLSRAESCFMSCSVSGLSAGADPREPSGRFSTDPHVRDFIMDRFLPAARAMAASPPPHAPWKTSLPSREPARRATGNVGVGRPLAVPPLPHQHRPGHALNHASVHHQVQARNHDDGEDEKNEEEEDEEEEEYGGAGQLSVKGCGFLPKFCMKSSFCLLNPVPGMTVRDHMPLPAARMLRPQVRASHHGSVGDAEDESLQHTWEEVYKHKLGRVHQILGEEASKLTSESNQLSYWSDSQTADGSSSHRRSTGGGISPYRSDVYRSPLHEGKGFLGVPKNGCRSGENDDDVFELRNKSGEKYWEITPHLGSKQTSGSQSPTIEKTVYVDSVEVLEDPRCKSILSDSKGVINCMHKDLEIARESQRMEESLMVEACEKVVSQHELTEGDDADQLCFAERSSAVETMSNAEDHLLDDPLHLKAKNQGKNGVVALQALAPPPLPKSPSESWLWRTLPSVASKNSAPMSFLGIQFCPRKQVIRASSTDPRREIMVKKSGVPKNRMRFADVLARPASED